MRAFIEQDYDRSGGLLSATNHFLLKGGDQWKGRLHELMAPLLVIHGTSDPIFPVEHGEALAGIVAGAKIIRVEGGGHELHPDDWDVIVAGIAGHVRGNDAQELWRDKPATIVNASILAAIQPTPRTTKQMSKKCP